MTNSTPESAPPGAVGRAVARALARAARRGVAELALASRAARQFRSRPGLALAVAALASLGFISTYTSRAITWRYLARGLSPRARRDVEVHRLRVPRTFLRRWALVYQHGGWLLTPILLEPATRFAAPLRHPSELVSGWMGLASYRLWPPKPSVIEPRDFLRYYSAIVIPTELLATLLFVGLLGWVRDGDQPLRLRAWPRYWRDHYLPVLALGLIVVAWGLLWLTLSLSIGARFEARFIAHPVGYIIQSLPIWALLLAPFVIVGRRVGVRAGIVEGIRLLRSRWASLVALFLIFRLCYEALVVWKAAAPWALRAPMMSISIASPAVWWAWAHDVGLALLGLWLAYAFMDIARGPAAPMENADSASLMPNRGPG